MPEKADGVPLAYVGKDTRSATPLILTLGASGGDIIGSLAKDRPLQVLLVDSDGNHLIKTAFGITGWAQQGEDGDSETFPALKTVQDVHYNLVCLCLLRRCLARDCLTGSISLAFTNCYFTTQFF